MSFISKKLKEFDERYPEFNGIGASHPIFQENPNPNHIKQFLTQTLAEFADKIRLEEKKTTECLSGSPEDFAQQEKERVIKHLRNYLIKDNPLCEQNALLKLIIEEIK